MFLTSDNGLKILWDKLKRVYPRLGPKQKSYFNSNINAPCPYKGAVKKTSAIYFWKFLNQYICAVGGPGSLIPKSGLNAYLLKNIRWKNEGTRESKGVAGGWPHVELATILTHLGFRRGVEYRVVEISQHKYKFPAEWTNPILLVHGEKYKNWYSGLPLPTKNTAVNNKNTGLLLVKGKYELTGAVVYVEPAENSGGLPHVWSCSIRNGKGYITDSNYPTSPKECNWWLNDKVKNFLGTVNVAYRPNRAKKIVFDVLLYTRKDYTDQIAPYCLIAYRPLTNNNKAKLRELENNYGPNAGGYFINTSEARKQFAPRVAAEAKRQYAARPFLNAAMLQNIVNEAGSFNHGIRIVGHKVRHEGFRVNYAGPNFKNFRRKLIAKFPVPVNKSIFNYLWKNSSSNSEFVRRLRNHANRAGRTVNENQLRRILATRAKTRAAAKRVRNAENERIYLVNNTEWRNSNGTNVTNKINASNWARTNNNNVTPLVKSYTNATNVKTFKRKVANFNAARAAAVRARRI
jgi:hypothetical protein